MNAEIPVVERDSTLSTVECDTDQSALSQRELTQGDDHIRLRSCDRMASLPHPRTTSVYRYYDAAGLLLYVGITARGTRRQGEHNRDKEWWPFVATQTVEHFGSREEASAREKSLIRTFRPPFNKQHNPFHADLRTLYLTAREAGAMRQVPKSQALSELGKIRHRLSLSAVSCNGERAILATDCEYGHLVRAVDWTRAPLMTNRKVGSLIDCSLMGDRAVLTFDLRQEAPPFSRAVAHLKANAGERRVWVHQIKVVAE